VRLDGGEQIVEAVTRFVVALASQAGLPRPKAYWLRLATEEISVNIVRHGYRGTGPLWLTAGIQPESVWLRIEDEAPAFDPMSHDRHSQLAIDPGEQEEGGFGLLLALHKLDEFSYEYVDGRNCNTLVMRRTIGIPDGEFNCADRG
jgi:anti-sigma regulatory factor (Ser/Thr protein kinase)